MKYHRFVLARIWHARDVGEVFDMLALTEFADGGCFTYFEYWFVRVAETPLHILVGFVFHWRR